MPAPNRNPEISHLDLPSLMRLALHGAEAAGRAGELPIGAVLVIDGQVVSAGRARHRERHSQIMHAELGALLDGGDALWRDYDRAVLVSTVEPCPMCLGAAVMADVPHIVFAAHDRMVDSAYAVQTIPYIKRHVRTYLGGVLEEESRALIARFDPHLLACISNMPT